MSTDAAAATPAPVPATAVPLPQSLAGATVMIAGGSSGIGLAAGTLLRTVGARVVLVGRDPDRLAAAADRVRKAGPAGEGDAVLTVAGDAGDERTLAEVFDAAGHVDHAYVTAGGHAAPGLLGELSDEGIRAAVAGGMGRTFALARAAARWLPAGGSLTLSSGVLLARPVPGLSVTLAAGGAAEALTRALAVELAPARQRVNAVRYGAIDTPLMRSLPGMETDEAISAAGASVPLGRFGTAEEAAAAALFLMSNPYVTGQIITVDGGHVLG
ncbi:MULTISPECIES: SDR family oxidoreductase [unclassified Streptomyces]|uniref:SDR family oxidoreductase n=1 Tax=unclassified Streptomyces TaxID=2593676 RepID=UPI002E1B691B|nr:SDR family oxidoreductase [Streptomyces sp. NBC_01023]